MEREYNLLEEAWIKVRTIDGSIQEVSLTEVLIHSHKYQDLAGEMATQDAAILRLLIGILFTVFSRVDETGQDNLLSAEQDYDEALERWRALWEAGYFPKQPIEDYLNTWSDRFWLFDEKYPFWQIPEKQIYEQLPNDKKPTFHPAHKMNGEISESGNKIRLFPVRTGQNKESLTFAEAARWLISVNAWDDSASTKGNIGASPGCGWLGKCGLVYAVGEKLFQTLMLNLTFLRDGVHKWGDSNPFWEKDADTLHSKYGLVCPSDPASLYTLRSRYMLLKKENQRVIGVYSAKKEIFPESNAFVEQMTMWQKRNKNDQSFPQKHDASRIIWREFTTIFKYNGESEDGTRDPGILSWIRVLVKNKCMNVNSIIRYRIVDVKYDSNKGSIIDTFSDSLTLHANLLSDLGKAWCVVIAGEIEKCESAAKAIGNLSTELQKASGMSEKIGATRDDRRTSMERHRDSDKQRFYSLIDLPFRSWLQEINPEQNEQDRDTAQEKWQRTARRIAIEQAQSMVDSAGTAAFIGRTVKEDRGSSTKHYSSPEAMNHFEHSIYRIYPRESE